MFNKNLSIKHCIIINIIFSLFYISVFYGFNLSVLSPTLTKSNIATEAIRGVLSENDKSTTFFLNVINLVGGYKNANILNFFISLFYLNFCIYNNKYIPFQFFWILVLSASIVLFLRIPHKEIVLIFSYFLIYLNYQYFGKKEKITLILLILFVLLYGYFARTYFLLIAFFYFTLFIFFNISKIQRFYFSILSIIIFFTIPLEYLNELQSHRDTASNYRIINSSWDGFRTSFINPLEITSHTNFIINYIYAFIRLNFPIFFDLTFKEIFHTIIIVGSFYIFFFKKINYQLSNYNFVNNIKLLMLAHFMVLWLFEPDLGSYLRHLLSYYPLLLFFTVNFLNNKLNEKK